MIAVGTEEEVERCRSRISGVVVERRSHLHVLEIVSVVGSVFLNDFAVHLGTVERAAGNEHAREELVLEANPLQAVGHFLLVAACLAEIFHIAAGILEVDSRVALLKHLTGFVTAHLLSPAEVHIGDVGGNDAVHILLEHVHLHVVVPGLQGVLYAPLAAAAKVELHEQGGIVERNGSEIEFLGVESLRVRIEHEAVAVGGSVEESHLVGIESVVLLERGFHDCTTARSDVDFHEVVLERHSGVGSCHVACKATVLYEVDSGTFQCSHSTIVKHGVIGGLLQSLRHFNHASTGNCEIT